MEVSIDHVNLEHHRMHLELDRIAQGYHGDSPAMRKIGLRQNMKWKLYIQGTASPSDIRLKLQS